MLGVGGQSNKAFRHLTSNILYEYYFKRKMNNEVYAAIAMALHDDLGYNLHDSESGRLTIVARDSEWSSKAAKMTAKV